VSNAELQKNIYEAAQDLMEYQVKPGREEHLVHLLSLVRDGIRQDPELTARTLKRWELDETTNEDEIFPAQLDDVAPNAGSAA
jgi:hypothetical protein